MMPAYIVVLVPPLCLCGKRATVEVRNGVNASVGKFCRSCGNRKVLELNDA